MIHCKPPDRISGPGPLLGAMRACRQAMTAASSSLKPMGFVHHALLMVVSAIDALATVLSGGRTDYFWSAAGGATAGETTRKVANRETQRSRPGAEELKAIIADAEHPTERT
jgi:hypothetical protein